MIRRRHSNLGGRVIYLLMAVAFVFATVAVGRIFPRRALIFAELAALVLLLLLLAVPKLRALMSEKKLWRLGFFAYAIPALGVVMMNNYAYPDHAFSPFWVIALVLAVLLAFGAYAFCVLRHAYPLWGAILVGLFFGVMSFFLLVLELQNINYAFDLEAPVCEVMQICDKKISRHTRNPDTYHFEVRGKAGSFWVEVQPGEYERYQIGEGYEVSRYRGALGEPFYLAE